MRTQIEIKRELLFGIILCLTAFCGKNPHNKMEDDESENQQKTRKVGKVKKQDSLTFDKSTAPKPEPKIDAKTIYVAKLRVADYSQKGEPLELIGFEVDGRAEHVEYMVCPLEETNQHCEKGQICTEGGACKKNLTSANRVILPRLSAGKISISVKGCVPAKKALTEETCGASQEIEYDSRRYDEEAGRLLLERDRLLASVEEIETDYRAALTEFVESSKKCMEAGAKVDLHLRNKALFSEMLLKSPIGWIGSSLGTMAMGPFGAIPGLKEEIKGVAQNALSTMKAGIKEVGHQMCEGMPEKDCQGWKAALDAGAGFATGFNPLHSLDTISGAIQDIVMSTQDPSALVKRNCHAEEILQKRQHAMEQVFNSRKKSLDKIFESLKERGY